MNYSIQCYIETLSSTEEKTELTLNGCDSYRFEKDEVKFNVIYNISERSARLKEQNTSFEIKNSTKNDFQLALQAYLNHKKVELEIDDNNVVESVKLL